MLLRPVTADDAEGMWLMLHDPEGRDLTATDATFTREQVDAWCASRGDQDERLDLAIVERATGEWAGEVVLNEPDGDTANLRIGLRGPACYGRGLGGEAVRLVVEHGLRTMGLHRITLTVLDRNQRALRCYERAGFRELRRYQEDGEHWVEMAIDGSRLVPDLPIRTGRLLLRAIEPERDVAAMHAYLSQEEVCRWIPPEPTTLARLTERLADPERTRSRVDAEGQALCLAVERRDTGELIGDVVLFWHSVSDGHAEVGYVLHPDHGGRGFATEAVGALVDLAFGVGALGGGLPVHRVSARMDARNTASARVCGRLGMRHEASYADGEWFKGEWTTLDVHAVLRAEWESRDRAGEPVGT